MRFCRGIMSRVEKGDIRQLLRMAVLLIFSIAAVSLTHKWDTQASESGDKLAPGSTETELSALTPASYSWSTNGPAGISVISLAIHPTDPDTVYAGTAGSGIYISANGGGSWASVSNEIDTMHVASMAINPQNPQIIYAGTVSGYEATGAYKTTNGGANWSHIVSGIEDLEITSLAINPERPDTVFAGVFINWDSWLGHGVFRTDDGGVSWRQTVSGMKPVLNLVVKDLAFTIGTPLALFAGTIHEGVGHGGVFKSTDLGNSWLAKNQGLKSLDISCLAIDPNDGDTMYACTRDSSVFKSTNGGDSWLRPTSLIIQHITSITMDPSNSQRIFMGTEGQGIYRSEDGGVSWNTINTGLGNLNILALDIVHTSSTILYAGTGSGVWQCIISETAR
ncbi:WD40/YVTN/BNR-like repeat-containing protein [Candidatus Zixiibacteriota bacterium]